MLDKIKYFAKLSSMAVVSLAKIYLLVFFSTTVSLAIGIFFLLKDDNDANVVAPHTSGNAGILALIVAKPLECFLIFLIFCCSILLVTLGYKYVAKKIIHRIINDKAEPLLYPLMDKVVSKFRTAQPEAVRAGGDYAFVKLQMVQNLKDESENRWLKRALAYGFRKVKMSDSDLKGDADFYDVFKRKAINALKNASEPGKTGIWLLVILQLVFAIVIAFR